MLILDHHPANARHTLALVGKGVTFDSGGISIKGAARMSTMKFDMGGAAAVVGAMRIIDALQLPIRVIGLCGLVENMPSSRAQRPGDVVTMHNGKSVEIISTDAEGRMVLADVISYAQQRFQPDYLLDIATLTGGAGVALGKEYAAMMGNDEAFLAQVTQAGQVSAEPVWPMPHGGWYRGVLKSEFADYRHGGEDPHGSPCVAATFISEFVQPGQRWAHLDIAAMSTDMPHRKLYANGASSFGVLLLARLSSLLAETEH
ncbi:Cytosol aminopeptidase [compost metagenome]